MTNLQTNQKQNIRKLTKQSVISLAVSPILINTAFGQSSKKALINKGQSPLRNTLSNHLVHYPAPSNLSYNWSFGSLVGLFFARQIVTGIFLARHYTPHVEYAFSSVEHIRTDVFGGATRRYFHANGALAIFILRYLHISRSLYYQSYVSRPALWYSGLIIFLRRRATAFIGYVLPWGQRSFWGATVITSLVTALPLVGEDIAYWIWGGFSIDNATLTRFFSAHYLLPFRTVGRVATHLTVLHTAGSSDPFTLAVTPDKISFHPYFSLKDSFIFVAVFSLFGLLLFYVPNRLGHADNYIPADALSTPAHIVPEWYFTPFYAVLRACPNKAGGALGRFAAILVLFAMPKIVNLCTIHKAILAPYTALHKIKFRNFLNTLFCRTKYKEHARNQSSMVVVLARTVGFQAVILIYGKVCGVVPVSDALLEFHAKELQARQAKPPLGRDFTLKEISTVRVEDLPSPSSLLSPPSSPPAPISALANEYKELQKIAENLLSADERQFRMEYEEKREVGKVLISGQDIASQADSLLAKGEVLACKQRYKVAQNWEQEERSRSFDMSQNEVNEANFIPLQEDRLSAAVEKRNDFYEQYLDAKAKYSADFPAREGTPSPSPDLDSNSRGPGSSPVGPAPFTYFDEDTTLISFTQELFCLCLCKIRFALAHLAEAAESFLLMLSRGVAAFASFAPPVLGRREARACLLYPFTFPFAVFIGCATLRQSQKNQAKRAITFSAFFQKSTPSVYDYFHPTIVQSPDTFFGPLSRVDSALLTNTLYEQQLTPHLLLLLAGAGMFLLVWTKGLRAQHCPEYLVCVSLGFLGLERPFSRQEISKRKRDEAHFHANFKEQHAEHVARLLQEFHARKTENIQEFAAQTPPLFELLQTFKFVFTNTFVSSCTSIFFILFVIVLCTYSKQHSFLDNFRAFCASSDFKKKGSLWYTIVSLDPSPKQHYGAFAPPISDGSLKELERLNLWIKDETRFSYLFAPSRSKQAAEMIRQHTNSGPRDFVTENNRQLLIQCLGKDQFWLHYWKLKFEMYGQDILHFFERHYLTLQGRLVSLLGRGLFDLCLRLSFLTLAFILIYKSTEKD